MHLPRAQEATEEAKHEVWKVAMEKEFTDSCSKAGGDRIKHQKKSVKIKNNASKPEYRKNGRKKEEDNSNLQQERERRYGEFKEESFSKRNIHN